MSDTVEPAAQSADLATASHVQSTTTTDADSEEGEKLPINVTASIFDTHYNYSIPHWHQEPPTHPSTDFATASNYAARHRFDSTGDASPHDSPRAADVKPQPTSGSLEHSRFQLVDEGSIVPLRRRSSQSYPSLNKQSSWGANRSGRTKSQEEHDKEQTMLQSRFKQFEISSEHDNLLLWLIRSPVDNIRVRSSNLGEYQVGTVITAQIDEPIGNVLPKQIGESFLSVPVVDSDQLYRGVIDLLDIIWRIVSVLQSARLQLSGDSQADEAKLQRLSELKAEIFQTPVETVLRDVDWSEAGTVSNIKGALPLHRGFSLLYCAEAFSRRGVHRLPILTKEQQVVGLVTQSMFINLLALNLDFLGSTRYTTVRDIVESGSRKVPYTINETQTALEAFTMMVRKRVNGLAVVDSNGYLVDGISVRDIRGIGQQLDRFDALYLPVAQFKQLSRDQVGRGSVNLPMFYVTYDDTLETVIHKMTAGVLLHRVWLVESIAEPRPLQVISQRDVIRFLLFRCGLPATSEDV